MQRYVNGEKSKKVSSVSTGFLGGNQVDVTTVTRRVSRHLRMQVPASPRWEGCQARACPGAGVGARVPCRCQGDRSFAERPGHVACPAARLLGLVRTNPERGVSSQARACPGAGVGARLV